MNMVFVCTGNTCGSPMAEFIAKDIFNKEKLNINVWSRGTNVFVQTGMSANALLALKELGFDGSKHLAKQIEIEDIEKADIIVAMTNKQKQSIESLCNNLGKDVFTIKEFVCRNSEDIKNPFGGTLSDYEFCAKDIFDCIVLFPEIIRQDFKKDLL